MLRIVATVCFCIAVMTITVSGQCGGPSASSQCTDTLANPTICQTAFCINGTDMTNTDACDDPTLSDLVPNCAASCDKCAEYGYGCENTIPEDQCTALAGNCDNPDMLTVMEAWCPKTCALCPRPGGGASCNNLAQNCTALKPYCNNPGSIGDEVRRECPKTCGTCSASNQTMNGTAIPPGGSTPSGGSCNDLATNCAQNAILCNDPTYSALMHSQCQKTCGFCNGGGSNGNCVDCSPNCALWVSNGFCRNNGYTDQQKRDNCAKSCNLCAGQNIFCPSG